MTPDDIAALHGYIQFTIERSNRILEIIDEVLSVGMPRAPKEYQHQISLMLDMLEYSDLIPHHSHFEYSDDYDEQYDISRMLRYQEELFKRCTCIGVLFADIIRMITFSDNNKATEYVYLSAMKSMSDSLSDYINQLKVLTEKAEPLWQSCEKFQPEAEKSDEDPA